MEKGISLIEVLVVVSILLFLAVFGILAILNFQKETSLNNDSTQLLSDLRLVRQKTLSSVENSQWGIYFDTNFYIIFQGSDYLSRDINFDEERKLSKEVEFFNLSEQEIVFNRLTGTTNIETQIFLRLRDDLTKIKTIFVSESGQIDTLNMSASDLDRDKDSRHVHLNYSRLIDTETEKIILTFDNGFMEEISIFDYLNEGEFFWEKTIEIEGEDQVVNIRTHRLNNPDTQFCFHLDRRFNNKGLNIDLSGDLFVTPNLIRYEASGATLLGNSSFVSSLIWQ